MRHILDFLCEQKWYFLKSGFDYTGNANTAGGQRVCYAGNDVGDRFKWIWDGRTGIGDQNIITSFNDLDENGTYENESTTLYGAGGTYQGSNFTSTTATTVGWFMSFWRDAGSSWQIAFRSRNKNNDWIVVPLVTLYQLHRPVLQVQPK